MSRGYDYDERDWAEPEASASRLPISQGRSGGSASDPGQGPQRSFESSPGNQVRDPKAENAPRSVTPAKFTNGASSNAQ